MAAVDKRANTHSLVFSSDKGWTSWRLRCGYQASDPDRPCWPHTEYGERYDQHGGEVMGCVYDDWITNSDEGFTDFEWTFDLARAHWNGDSFEFTIGMLLHRHDDGIGEPSGPDVTILGPTIGSMPVEWPERQFDGSPSPSPTQSATVSGAGEAIADGAVRHALAGECDGSPAARIDGSISD